jgi:predicted nucleic acid-binding protein
VIVVDASSMVDYLARRGDAATWVAGHLQTVPDAHAPELIDAEALQGLRGLAMQGVISEGASMTAVSELLDARIVRYPHRPFVERAWALRGQLTMYDALYVALAEALGATLVTTDLRLCRAVTTVEVAAPG